MNFMTQVESFDSTRLRFDSHVKAGAQKQRALAVSGKEQSTYNPRGQLRMQQKKAARAAATVKSKTTAFGVTDDEIKERLFKQFQSFQYYRLTDLKNLLKLPMDRVRNVLLQIAERDEEGEFKGRWKLKDEYK